ncbi:MAG TPA: RES domain-containing protein [Mycobacterium sp.]|nr:RES domain-containing protein [Mycobacterium sp.]
MPELAAGYRNPLPAVRPTGLARRQLAAGTELWRLEAQAPQNWCWAGFPQPRFRFDPASGAFRTRYAGSTVAGAARERYRATGLLIPADHAEHHLVRLVAARPLRVLDLRTERNLDRLDLDDQISTGQHPAVWRTCQRLSDAVRRWWPDAPDDPAAPDALDALVYRSRTTPESSLNVAIFGADAFTAQSWPLAGRPDVLADLVLHHGFTVGWEIGS